MAKETVTEREVALSFGSEFEYLDLVQDVSDHLSEMVGFDEETRYWIGLSLRESVANAIQHGNKLDESKRVGVRFQLQPDRLVILVEDQGEGFDESKLTNPLDQENLLKPSGRGIFYMRSFMDEVCFRTIPGGGLEIRMEKKLNHEKQGEGDENR